MSTINIIIDIIILIIFFISIGVTFKYRFIQLKCFTKARKVLFKDKQKNSYQTFLVSLGSHIGTGNIIGVSTALIYGGSGSIIWLWIFTIFSSIFSLIENTLSLRYRVQDESGFRGGACYYLKNGLNKGFLALLFAIVLVLTNTILFQPIQINTVSETIKIVLGIDEVLIFGILSIFTVFVIFRGKKMIIRFSEFVVPLMSIGYILVCVIVIIMNISFVPQVIIKMCVEAFNLRSIEGGIISSCIMIGMKRSFFSNEAGLGTIPSISSMSEIEKPIDQGYVQTYGVFIDTIICTLTAFLILIYGIKLDGFEGCDLIICIFTTIFGNFGLYLSAFFMLSFALATVVSQYFLGESNLLYLVNNYHLQRKKYRFIFKLLFISGIAIGVFLSTKDIFSIIDLTLVILGTINIYAILCLKKEFDKELFEGKMEINCNL